MITLILKMIFLDVLWVLAWKIATSDDMVLEAVGKWGNKMNDKYKIFDGLVTCPYCLGNIHGLLFVWPLALFLGIVPLEWDWKYLAIHFFMVAGTSITCGVIWGLHEIMLNKIKYWQHKEQNEFFDLKDRKQNHHFKNKR